MSVWDADQIPSSRRPPFPCVAKSVAMEKFFTSIAYHAGHQRIVPIVLGPNLLEFRSLLDMILKRVELPGRSGPSRDQLLFEPCTRVNNCLDDTFYRGVVFLRGDDLATSVQAGYVAGRHPHHEIVIALVTAPAETLVTQGKWTPTFFNLCGHTVRMPSWMERTEDHNGILHAMLDRIDNPPAMHTSAKQFFGRTPFDGVDAVKRCFDQGYTKYLVKEQIGGMLVASHFSTPRYFMTLDEAQARQHRGAPRSAPPLND